MNKGPENRGKVKEVLETSLEQAQNAIAGDVVIGPTECYGTRASKKLWLKKGCELAERAAWSEMTITIISGSCTIEMNSKVHQLKLHDELSIAANIEHRIVACDDLRAILTFDGTQIEE